MRNKIVIIITFVMVIGGFGAFSKILDITSTPKEVEYKPYVFTTQNEAELVITKFIRAIESGDVKTAASLIEKDRNYHATIKNITKFYNKYHREQAKKYILLYPRELVFSDSIVTMQFEIRNVLRYNEKKEAIIVLVNNENQWLIKTSSSFFEVLMRLSDNEKEKENNR